MKWFQTDSDAPNDPKLKAVIRAGLAAADPGQAAAGAVFLLWCYIANHGKGEPGVGVRADGSPLALIEMAGECLFTGSDELTVFLNKLAAVEHIHQAVWHERGVVFLPAMWERTSAYYRSKSRKLDYDTAAEVAGAVLAGSAQTGQVRAEKALPNKPTNKPDHTHQKKTVGPTGRPSADLLDDGGPDQVQAVVDLWNKERHPGPKVRGITDGRRRHVLALLKAHPNLDEWRQVIRYVNKQRWCNAPGTGDHPNWRMDFDYLLKPGKFLKALESLGVIRPTAADGTVGRDASKGRTGSRPGEFAAALEGADEKLG